MIKLITYTFSFLFVVCGFSQQVVIMGEAPAFKGKEMAVYVYDDLISYRELEKETVTVDDSGKFKFSFTIKETQKIFLQAGKQRSHMFIEPGKSYKVFVPATDSTKYVNPNIINEVGLYFMNKDSLELNNLVIDFNEKVNEFWYNNYTAYMRSKGRARLDSFSNAKIKEYSTVKNEYIKKHVEYSLGSLTHGMSQGNKGWQEKYFVDKPVLYNNYEYMYLFNEIFKKYFLLAAYDKNGNILVDLILRKANYEKISEMLLLYNPNLKNDTLRELVMLKGLPDLYYMADFDKNSVLALLEQIEQKTKIEEHKKIATNVRYSFSKLSAGMQAPDFILKDKNGKEVKLSDFRGKYVYLDFWATWCGPCIQEMKVVPELHKTYHDKIVFVSISVDEDVEKMKAFLAKNPKYEWVFLYSGKDKLKDDYEIRTVPTYFLIGPDGKFIESPAAKPSGGIEERFYKITKVTVKKKKVGEK